MSKTIRIVCLEDDAEITQLIQFILSREAYEVSFAEDGEEGLKLIEETVPDLVLLDLLMPKVDGWEVFQRMKANDALSHIPVIVVSAKADNVDKVFGLRVAKVDEYITKPFHAEQLLQAIRKVLATPSE